MSLKLQPRFPDLAQVSLLLKLISSILLSSGRFLRLSRVFSVEGTKTQGKEPSEGNVDAI